MLSLLPGQVLVLMMGFAVRPPWLAGDVRFKKGLAVAVIAVSWPPWLRPEGASVQDWEAFNSI